VRAVRQESLWVSNFRAVVFNLARALVMLRGTGWPYPSPLTSSCVLALSLANILVVAAAPTRATERKRSATP
jgi:hypothetical protein